jgi:perosamine synthetase
MTGYQAAMGRVQLRKIDRIIEQKRRVAHAYDRMLVDVPGVRTPLEAEWARNIYWMYVLVLEDEFPLDRDELMTSLREAGVDTRTHFCPMNMQPFLQREPGFRELRCPVAERLWERGLYLPSSITLTEQQIEAIVDRVRAPAPA